MNGRVYDPFLARMISADPTVPGPFNGQAFNRYAYVFNNPLSLVDPSGFGPELGPLGTPHADGSGGVTLDPVAVNGEPVDDDRFPTDNGGASPTSSLTAFGLSGMSALGWFNPQSVSFSTANSDDTATALDPVEVNPSGIPRNISWGMSIDISLNFALFNLGELKLFSGASLGADGFDFGALLLVPSEEQPGDVSVTAPESGDAIHRPRLGLTGGVWASTDSTLSDWFVVTAGELGSIHVPTFGATPLGGVGAFEISSSGGVGSIHGVTFGPGLSVGYSGYSVFSFSAQGFISATLCRFSPGCY